MTQGQELDFSIDTLGVPALASPIALSTRSGDLIANYVDDDERLLYQIKTRTGQAALPVRSSAMELAGPRSKIFFDPVNTHAAVVTCGGLCPGLNDVIRAIVMSLWHHYGVRRISGIRFGYRGLLPEIGLPPLELTPTTVMDIHRQGGTMLGSSRGYGDRTEELADTLQQMGVNMLFTIGGDGTQKGALDLAETLMKRAHPLAVVGIPKTIDNDLSFVQRSFGFDTAVSIADQVVAGAHVEASGAPNGIGIVKLMGRQSGFIAAAAALANNDVNFVLIPEVPFDLAGEKGFFQHLERRLEQRNHAVVVVAEGAGQDLLQMDKSTDASGNKRLGDIGLYLSDCTKAYFKQRQVEINLKYIDPSYIIRSTPANAHDSIYCARLGAHAVHAAMAGKTGLLVSLQHGQLVHVPIRLATAQRNTVDPESPLWLGVLEATGQPAVMKN
jgi:6-phosphofructokinase 1